MEEEVLLGEYEANQVEGEQTLPGNFSKSLNLFQSIHVLANEEEERAFWNETASSKTNSDNDELIKPQLRSEYVHSPQSRIPWEVSGSDTWSHWTENCINATERWGLIHSDPHHTYLETHPEVLWSII